LKKVLFLSAVLFLLAVIGYSGYQLWDIHRNQVQEAEIHSRIMRYRPTLQMPVSTHPIDGSYAERSGEFPEDYALVPKANQSIVDLQAEHAGVVGWLTVPNTKIDYPFVQGADNNHYLHLDLDQRWSAAGTIFMDFRNNSDFSDFHTIVYGHHMRSGSMFGTLQQFNNQAFFETNRTGTIFLAHATYEIEFMAFAVTAPNDTVIYNPTITTEADQIAFLDHVKRTARYYRDIGATAEDRMITLSTCSYEFNNARMVLIGRLTEVFLSE